MMWLHPLLQTAALLFSLHVLYLGYVRFKALHRGVKGQLFLWKRHVLWGSLVMLAWTAGMSLGLVMAKTSWNAVFLTGAHWMVGLLMLPLAVFGYVSGRVMDQRKAKRVGLPLAHGINNAVLVLLAAFQFVTGVGIIRDMLIP